MLVRFNEGTKDVPMTEVTAENYIVPSNELHKYHVILEVKKFNSENGERLSKPHLQKFGKKTYEKILPDLKKQGFSITMLYDPTEYLSKLREMPVEPRKRVDPKEELEKALNAQREELMGEIAKMQAQLLEEREAHKKEIELLTQEKKGGRPKKSE